jgi:hypothetical protein
MNKEPVYYRKTDIKKFEDFKDGDCICELCNGWGYFYDCEDNRVSQCHHCRGVGKLDWITNVTGVSGMSGTPGSSTFPGMSNSSGFVGTSGYGKISTKPIHLPPSPRGPIHPPPPKRTIPIARNKKSIPNKAVKKISLKEKIMNAVADK